MGNNYTCDSKLITGHANVILIFDCINWDFYVDVFLEEKILWNGSDTNRRQAVGVYNKMRPFVSKVFLPNFATKYYFSLLHSIENFHNAVRYEYTLTYIHSLRTIIVQSNFDLN